MGFSRFGRCEMTIPAPRVFISAMIQLASKALSAIKAPNSTPLDQRRDPHRVVALSRQQNESDEVAQGIGEGQDFGRHAALGFANGLALSPPFPPCPWRWTLTMVASTMAYSMSGSSEVASKSRLKTSAFTQSRYRLKTVFQGPNSGGRSRHGLPVRAIHNTASTKRRL